MYLILMLRNSQLKVLFFCGSVIAYFFCCYSTCAQVITTSNGESSILIQNTNIGLNIGETELSFNANNKTKTLRNSFGLTWGGRVSAKNKDGIGAFFNNEELTPSAHGSIVFGIYSNNTKKFEKRTDERLASLRTKQANSLKKPLELKINKLKTEYFTKPNLDDEEINKINGIISKILESELSYIKNINKELTDYKYDKSDATKVAIEEFLDELNSFAELMGVNEIQNDIEKENKARAEFLKNKNYYSWNVYLHGGLRAEKFKIFSGWNTEDLSNSYLDVDFKGSTFGAGINIKAAGDWLIGLRYTYDENNNTEFLSQKEYTYVVEQVLNNSKVTTTDKFKAYTGDYQRVYLSRYDADIIRVIPLGPKNFMMLDLYTRSISSSNEQSYASATDIGLSSLFFKSNGNFMGGVYLELPDVDQNQESLNDVPEYKRWYNRLSFGIYGKYSFNSLLGFN